MSDEELDPPQLGDVTPEIEELRDKITAAWMDEPFTFRPNEQFALYAAEVAHSHYSQQIEDRDKKIERLTSRGIEGMHEEISDLQQQIEDLTNPSEEKLIGAIGTIRINEVIEKVGSDDVRAVAEAVLLDESARTNWWAEACRNAWTSRDAYIVEASELRQQLKEATDRIERIKKSGDRTYAAWNDAVDQITVQRERAEKAEQELVDKDETIRIVRGMYSSLSDLVDKEQQKLERIRLQHQADGRFCRLCGAAGGTFPCDTAAEFSPSSETEPPKLKADPERFPPPFADRSKVCLDCLGVTHRSGEFACIRCDGEGVEWEPGSNGLEKSVCPDCGGSGFGEPSGMPGLIGGVRNSCSKCFGTGEVEK